MHTYAYTVYRENRGKTIVLPFTHKSTVLLSTENGQMPRYIYIYIYILYTQTDSETSTTANIKTKRELADMFERLWRQEINCYPCVTCSGATPMGAFG